MANANAENEKAKGIDENQPKGQISPSADAPLVETMTPTFIRKRRKRRRILVVFALASVGILAFGIIAFLGQNFGDFTIKIDPSTRAALALGQSLTDNENGYTDIDKGTSYLDMSGIGNIACTTADMIPTADFLDADVETGDEDAKLSAILKEANRLDIGAVDQKYTSLNFLYFTFYLKNMSNGPVRYFSTLATTNIREPDNVGISCTLESLLRVRVFKNTYREGSKYYKGDEATHDFTTYALPTDAAYTPENVREKEDPNADTYRSDNDGLCTNFVKPTEEQSAQKNFTVFNEVAEIARFSIIRYTVVFWLEGSDLDTTKSHVKEQPRGGSITLGMNFGGVNIDEE